MSQHTIRNHTSPHTHLFQHHHSYDSYITASHPTQPLALHQPTPSSPNPRHWACANLDPARSNKRCNSARLTKPSPFSSRRSKLLRSNLADNKSRPRKNGPEKRRVTNNGKSSRCLCFLRFMNLCTNDGRFWLLTWLFSGIIWGSHIFWKIYLMYESPMMEKSPGEYTTHTHTHTHTTLRHIFPARRHCNSQWHEGTKAATKRENSTHPPPSLKRRIAACPGFFGTNRFNMDIFHLEIPVIQ